MTTILRTSLEIPSTERSPRRLKNSCFLSGNSGTVESQDLLPNNHLARKGRWELKERHTDAILATTKLEVQSA